jgi:hypothetical protein
MEPVYKKRVKNDCINYKLGNFKVYFKQFSIEISVGFKLAKFIAVNK